jgi:uncharacterized protein
MPRERGQRRIAARWFCIPIGFFIVVLAVPSFLFFRQHAMIYHPRPYDSRYGVKLPANGVEINYTVSAGKCSAFYIPSREVFPKRLWIAFCGNGSLALDWLANILVNYPVNGDAFLLVDYPGYGKNAGYAMIDSTRASADAAVRALEERLHMPEERLTVCTIGHSLGAAVALDFAARHQVERVVAIAPFTTLREEAARVVGWQLAQLLRENYDNRENLARIARHNPKARIGIFHGTADENIPVEMGRELAREFPFVEFFAIDDANHVSVLDAGHDKIVDWMNR